MRASCFLTEKFRIVEEIQSELEMRLGTLAGHKTHKHAWPSGPRLSSVARPRAQFSHATRFPLLGKQRSEKSCQVHLVIKCKRNQLRGGYSEEREEEDVDATEKEDERCLERFTNSSFCTTRNLPTVTPGLGFLHPVWHREAEWTRDFRIARLLTATSGGGRNG